MKTSVKYRLRASRSMPQRGVLVMYVTRHRLTRTKSSSCALSVDEWDETGQKIIFPENASAQRKKELAAIERKLKKHSKDFHETLGIVEKRNDYTAQELVNLFRQRQQGQMFCGYVFGKAESLHREERFGTAKTYRYAAVSFRKFLKGRDVRMDKIDAALLEEYERYLLSEGKKPNTVSCYMRSLRAGYNQAIREKILVVKKVNDNPFLEVFTGNAKTPKRAISGESISQLASLELPEVKVKGSDRELNEVRGINSLALSRDLFLFSFYTQGMSFADMVSLKKENIRDGFIRYRRKKTGQQICIELEDCIREIIGRYADSNSDLIFPVLRETKDFKDFKDFKESKDLNVLKILNVPESYENWKKTAAALTTCNKNLKKLADMAGIGEHLTSYVARHSWASIASQEGIPIATISRGLGHESKKTTQIYISRTDYSDVGRANRKILSRIHNPTPKSPKGDFAAA